MTLLKEFLLLIILPLVCSRPQINLDLTDWNRENNDVLQHDCIDVLARRFSEIDPQQIISYCLSELPSKWKIRENTVDRKLNFLQLKELGVTSEQLYHWSAPMDTIENYQFYLNQLLSISTDWFYNCTSSTFGPLCQYSFDGYESSSSSLRDIILDYYSHAYRPTSMTCYTHVNCTFNGRSICLDWRNICDGQADCPINGIDEKYCSVQI